MEIGEYGRTGTDTHTHTLSLTWYKCSCFSTCNYYMQLFQYPVARGPPIQGVRIVGQDEHCK